MVMPARVADAQGRDVLCGEGAAGMQRWASHGSRSEAPCSVRKSLVRALHPGMRK